MLRALVIVAALSVAAFAGLAFVVIASLTSGLSQGSLDAFAGFALFVWMLTLFGSEVGWNMLPILGALVAMFILAPVVMPGALVAILAEAFGWRSLTAHMAGNAAVSLVTGGVLGLAGGMMNERAIPQGEAHVLVTMAATGAVIGLVYWAIAGRKATGFLVRKAPQPAP